MKRVFFFALGIQTFLKIHFKTNFNVFKDFCYMGGTRNRSVFAPRRGSLWWLVAVHRLTELVFLTQGMPLSLQLC